MNRRWLHLSGLLAGGPLLLVAASCAVMRGLGIGGDDPRWVEQTVADATRADVARLVQTVLEREYTIQRSDLSTGEIETTWLYGGYEARSRKQLRERVVVEMEHEDDGSIRLRLRVQQEINEELGRMLAQGDGDWKAYVDDETQARILAQHIRVLLREDPEPERPAGS
jgi:hypothetical protein